MPNRRNPNVESSEFSKLFARHLFFTSGSITYGMNNVWHIINNSFILPRYFVSFIFFLFNVLSFRLLGIQLFVFRRYVIQPNFSKGVVELKAGKIRVRLLKRKIRTIQWSYKEMLLKNL